MPPKFNEQQEEVLQAVVIADSFNERFMPITLDRPRCLLPLVNTPLIEYTLEFLAISKVQEVILFIRSHADQIKQYIGGSRWSKPTSPMHIQVVLAPPECASVGDALREIDSRSLLRGDFVLVAGDVVSNMNLEKALTKHRERRQKDKNSIMTMVLKKASPSHRSRERCESAVFAIDTATQECLSYVPVDSEVHQTHVEMALEAVKDSREVAIRFDLLDCQIDICSLQVLALFTENFDYQDIRRDFVRGVLTSDILGMRIHCHILRDEYAARVRSPRLYGAVSRDLVARWAFPIVPEAAASWLEETSNVDFTPGLAAVVSVGSPASTVPAPIASNMAGSVTSVSSHVASSPSLSAKLALAGGVEYRRGYRYLGPGVILAHSVQLEDYSVLGAGSTVGDHSRISASVIGARCQIGANVVIERCFIWDGCRIESGCSLTDCIVADGCVLEMGTTLQRGCLLSSNVRVGPKITIPAGTRVAKLGDHLEAMKTLTIGSYGSQQDVAMADSYILSQDSTRLLGANSDGFVWQGDVETTDDRECQLEVPQMVDELVREERLRAFSLGAEMPKLSTMKSIDSSSEDDDDDDVSDEGDGESLYVSEVQPHAKFIREAIETVKNSIQSGHTLDNAALELNGLKFASNATFPQCQRAIIEALFLESTALTPLFTQWGPLLARFCHGHAEQVGLIQFIRDHCEAHSQYSRYFTQVIPLLYKVDVLEQEAICEWYAAEATQHGPDSLYCRQIKSFVTWLEEESDDGGEEEDSEDEEDE